MQFFFRYLTGYTVGSNGEWGPLDDGTIDIETWDEQIVSWSMTHAEAAFATARIQVQARETSYHALGRHAVLAVRLTDDGPIKPIIRGTITAVPRGLRDELVEMELISKPDDWEEQEAALIEALAVAPWFDPMLEDAGAEKESDKVLRGYAAVLAWDRVDGSPRISHIDSGPRTVTLDRIVYEGMNIEPDEPPLHSMTAEITATWLQDASVSSTVSWNFGSKLEVMAHEAALDAWPQPGADLGGNWVVEESELTFAQPYFVQLGKVAGGYDEAIYSGTLPVYRAKKARVLLRNNRTQARSETVHITANAAVPDVMSTTTETEVITLRRVIGSGDQSDPWQATVSYSVGDIVFYERHLYECTADHVALYTFSPAFWTQLEDSAGKIGTSFFSTNRGFDVIRAAVKRITARLRYAARAVRVRFEIPLADAVDLRPDDMITVADRRIPGGTATGKLVSLTINATEDGGRWAEVEIACSVASSNFPATPFFTPPTGYNPPLLGPASYPATGSVTPLAAAQLAALRETPDTQTLEVRVQIDAPAVPATYELAGVMQSFAGTLNPPRGIAL